MKSDIAYGFRSGLGFWLAGLLVMFFGVPLLTCISVIALMVLGKK